MQAELSVYYYNSALKYAKDGCLDRALELCAAAWGISEQPKEKDSKSKGKTISETPNKDNNDSDEPRKLAGLCYLALGNYSMAEYCFNGLAYYTEDIQKAVKEKMEFANSVSILVDNGQYRQAIKALERRPQKSVAEFNLLGCLYAIKRKRDKAVYCFSQALGINRDGSVVYLEDAMKIKRNWLFL